MPFNTSDSQNALMHPTQDASHCKWLTVIAVELIKYMVTIFYIIKMREVLFRGLIDLPWLYIYYVEICVIIIIKFCRWLTLTSE